MASKVRSVPALNKNRNMLVKNGTNKNDIVVKVNELKEPDKIYSIKCTICSDNLDVIWVNIKVKSNN